MSEMRKLQCGHELEFKGDIKKYVAALLEHVKNCPEAQRLLAEDEEKRRKEEDEKMKSRYR